METPRFKVTSLTGYNAPGGNNAALATTYQVLDTACCYELVIETSVRSSAAKCAAALNAGDYDYVRRLHAQRAYQARYRAMGREPVRATKGTAA